MKARTTNPNNTGFHRYGGRGIKCCERWMTSFQNFLDDMGCRPTLLHSIERIDNDGNYCPENCRWATKKEQARNRCSSRIISFNGVEKQLAAWAEEYNLTTNRLYKRLKEGWTMEQALSKPVRRLTKGDQFRIIEFNGQKKTLKEWSVYCGIDIRTMRQRVNRGWTPERMMTTPIKK